MNEIKATIMSSADLRKNLGIIEARQKKAQSSFSIYNVLFPVILGLTVLCFIIFYKKSLDIKTNKIVTDSEVLSINKHREDNAVNTVKKFIYFQNNHSLDSVVAYYADSIHFYNNEEILPRKRAKYYDNKSMKERPMDSLLLINDHVTTRVEKDYTVVATTVKYLPNKSKPLQYLTLELLYHVNNENSKISLIKNYHKQEQTGRQFSPDDSTKW